MSHLSHCFPAISVTLCLIISSGVVVSFFFFVFVFVCKEINEIALLLY